MAADAIGILVRTGRVLAEVRQLKHNQSNQNGWSKESDAHLRAIRHMVMIHDWAAAAYPFDSELEPAFDALNAAVFVLVNLGRETGPTSLLVLDQQKFKRGLSPGGDALQDLAEVDLVGQKTAISRSHSTAVSARAFTLPPLWSTTRRVEIPGFCHNGRR